ncbi:hypothetical protein HMPREF0580_0751 [Mobiluncus mulieris ATCC 35239]|uniref:Uncharacterized protein n=1 Tax=Mobiluncus mulieris ATCC 35239 TaxID=871571 RepID=E0QPD6_9ACTO|nr:hypothetical protein HMPREF0580_0751 [Mobiluncus mulieris ATCC 35239]
MTELRGSLRGFRGFRVSGIPGFRVFRGFGVRGNPFLRQIYGEIRSGLAKC